MTTQPPYPGRLERLLRQLTILVGLAIRLGGLYFILKIASHPPIDALSLAVSAFMMSGAQLTESGVLKLIDRFLGREPEHKDTP